MHDDGGGGDLPSTLPPPPSRRSEHVPDPGDVSAPPVTAETPGESSAPFPGESSAPLPPPVTPRERSAPEPVPAGTGDTTNVSNNVHTGSGYQYNVPNVGGDFNVGNTYNYNLDLNKLIMDLLEKFESVEINFKPNGIEVKTGATRLPGASSLVAGTGDAKSSNGGGNIPGNGNIGGDPNYKKNCG
jgi:hypothetical protein